MRFTSLIVELIRARPQLVVVLALALQAVLWLILPLLIFGAPPGQVAHVLAVGREYQLGSDLGPPLAFWLADIAFRAFGGHVAGVYLLTQLCIVVTFFALFRLGTALVGAPQAAVAVLLTLTIPAYAANASGFGPDVLALPLYAGMLLYGWQALGEGQRSSWFALGIAAGLLLLTTSAAPWLVLLFICLALATKAGRQNAARIDAGFAFLVMVIIALPWVIWQLRSPHFGLPDLATLAMPDDVAALAGDVALGLLRYVLEIAPMLAGVLILALVNSRWGSVPKDLAEIIRKPVSAFGIRFIWLFALGPAIVSAILVAAFAKTHWAAGAGITLLLAGLFVVLRSGDGFPFRREPLLRAVWLASLALPILITLAQALVAPWVATRDHVTDLPARDIARFFGETYERRTGKPLTIVAGQFELASLVAMGPKRPHLLDDANPARTPWVTQDNLNETGGLIVWRSTDTIGAPPPDLITRFPGLTAEVPRAFDRLVNGTRPVLRVGWAIIRPKQPSPTQP